MENLIKILNIIKRFNLNLYLDHVRDRVETSAFIKYNFRTNDRINNINKYEKEFQFILGDNVYLENKNGYISIVIPKKKPDIFPLETILSNDFYTNHPSLLKIALGEETNGEYVLLDLENEGNTNTLIGGVPGSGKSNLLNVIVNCLSLLDTSDVNLMLFDLKEGVELTQYNVLPHLLKPVITNIDRVESELKYLIKEMDRRFEEIKNNSNCKNIKQYRKKHNMPYLVVIIDELAEIMLKKKDCEKYIISLAQKGRACGIRLILATQRPSVDIVTSLIKSNMTTRIAFRVSSHYDSQVILDHVGAEKLGKHGDMLLKDEDGLLRLQCCYISDEYIDNNLNQFETNVEIRKELLQLDYTPQPNLSEFERLYNQAVELIEKEEKCSAWLFITELNIGRKKADELIVALQDNNKISNHKVGRNYEVYLKGELLWQK